MPRYQKHLKRVATDAVGYMLLLLAIATGWLPGPGGIPLAIAGLGLLSIHNAWAGRIRDYLLAHGGKIAQIIFPAIRWIQWLYDMFVIILFASSLYLAFKHAALWQTSLSIALFCIAIFIALMNRERLALLKQRRKHKH